MTLTKSERQLVSTVRCARCKQPMSYIRLIAHQCTPAPAPVEVVEKPRLGLWVRFKKWLRHLFYKDA